MMLESRFDGPYNRVATEYIQETYPAYWPSIRAYGWSHPALVPYINEDPDIMCSLMNLGWSRIINFGGSGYFETDIPMSNIRTLEAKMSIYNSVNYAFFGTTSSYEGVYYWQGYLWLSASKQAGALSASNNVTFNIANGQISVQNINTSIPSYGSSKMLIGKVGSVNGYAGKLSSFSVVGANNKGYQFVPFVRNSEVELLDVINLSLVKRYGSFSITKTLNA